MLVEHRFLVGNVKFASYGEIVISKLSWEGHEFLDDIRDPEIWRRTKERANAIAGVGLAFLWDIGKAEIRAKLSLP